MGYYTQLSQKERRQIEAFLDMGLNVANIGKRLNRHRSTIYREITRNKSRSSYLPIPAHYKALARKARKPFKLKIGSSCYKYVMKHLQKGWSPEQISGRMKLLGLAARVCHETIYQYIYKHAKKRIYYYLPMQRNKRKQRRKRKTTSKYNGFRSIDNRPSEVASRGIVGHWEGDTIRFSNERQQSITTLVERKSRFVVLNKNNKSTTNVVIHNVCAAIKDLSAKLWKSITFDQGTEFANCYSIERNTKCKVYYAHPRSPWLRGSNENTNKRLRRYLPKKCNIRGVNQYWLENIAKRLNSTPRKCLGYLTPKEVLFKEHLYGCRT